jgi:Dolichyl-phosphate-mannose-protein mannosyltransferase
VRARKERLLWLLVALAGAWVVWFGTANGVGVSIDSITYLRGAEHIARGEGYVGVGDDGRLAPVDHWPPLYSMTLAIPVAAGLSATHAARLVNALALFGLLYLSAVLVRRLAPDAAVAPILAMLGLLVAPTILRNHLMAWSESIFTPLILAGFLKIHDYLTRDRVRDLAVAGACFGLAAIDRYSGVAFIVGLATALVLRDRKERGPGRFVHPLVFFAVAGLPTAVWFVRNLLVAARAHDRTFEPHIPSLNHVRAMFDSVSLWLLPAWVPFRLRVLCLLVVVALLAALVRGSGAHSWRAKDAARALTRDWSQGVKFWLVVGLCVAAYLGFVLVTISFFDFDVNYDTRMMSPILVLTILFVATAGKVALVRPLSMPARLLSVLIGAASLLLAAHSSAVVRAAHEDPAQFAGDRWTKARAWEVVAAAPPDVLLYASSPYVTAYFIDREVLPLPESPPADADSAYLLVYPDVGKHSATLDAATRSLLRARVVDSTEVMILYRIER